MILAAPSAIEVTRYFSGALLLASLPFVIFDSLNKRVDVVSLKEKLDLKEARLNAIVVGAVERGLAPHLGTDLRNIGLELGFNPGVDESYSITPQSLSETAKDALVSVLRKCDPVLAEVLLIRRIPHRLSRLNRGVYSLAVVLAIASAISTLSTFWIVNPHLIWGLLIALSLILICTASCAVIRQVQVQDAEQAIIHEDAQPRT